jgi:hypothetical protein
MFFRPGGHHKNIKDLYTLNDKSKLRFNKMDWLEILQRTSIGETTICISGIKKMYRTIGIP